jgi:hypothetical protein
MRSERKVERDDLIDKVNTVIRKPPFIRATARLRRFVETETGVDLHLHAGRARRCSVVRVAAAKWGG